MNKQKLETKALELLAYFNEHPEKAKKGFKIVSAIARCLGFFGAATLQKKPKRFLQPTFLDPQEETRLKEKYNRYLELSEEHQDPYGFIEYDKCDSLLFTALTGIATQVEITAARDSDGFWQRRPTYLPPCWCPGDDGSTISRDMFIGLLWYIWRNRRLDLARDLFDHGKRNSWIMGQGDVARIYFTPGLQATLAEVIFRLGGPNYWSYRGMPQAFGKNIGYRAHLDVLHILLRGELLSGVNQREFDILLYNYLRVPTNPLFSYACHRFTDGDQSVTAANLQDSRYFPKDRLPSTADRYEPWLPQRDPGEDWEPDLNQDPPKVHSGGDFLFIAHLLLFS